MTTAIYDNFKKTRVFVHGDYVSGAFRDVTNLPFDPVENEVVDGEVNLNEDVLFNALKTTNAKVFNISFGSLNRNIHMDSDFGQWSPWYSEMKATYARGVTVVFAAGNDFADNYKGTGVSYIATTPWTVDCGSAKLVDGVPKMEAYTQYHPALSEYFMRGDIYDGHGTSFAAPRLAGIIAELQHRHGNTLSQAEVRTALNLICKLFEHEGEWYRFIDKSYLAKPYTRGVVTVEMKVAALYRLYLKRNPDAGGFEYWCGVARTRSIEDVAVAFKGEPEYKQTGNLRVPVIEQAQAMYHLWLNREADDAGLGWWTEQLVRGELRAVAGNFIAGARANGEKIDERLLF